VAADNRVVEEATVMRAVEKAVADKEATDKSTADEAVVKGVAVGTLKTGYPHIQALSQDKE
jgi:hypothetical protein